MISDGEDKNLSKSTTTSRDEPSSISAVGSIMWDFSLATHKHYLENTLKHYQRMAKNNQDDVSDIIDAYQTLANKR